ncbi:MAG TPA: rod shape-determining protein MreD [Acidimicrobiia bacterium]|nr:rod shape-determining protein MreD [Acidimicrobiia bacterium]
MTRSAALPMTDVRRRVGVGTLMLFALLAQVSLLPHLRVLGVVADVMIVATVAVAVRRGPEYGGVFGFAAGLLVDLFLQVPVGLSALAYSIVGYAVGLAQSSLLRERWWLAPLLAGLGSLAAGLVFVLAGLILGQEYLLDLRSFLVLPARALYDAALALIVFPVTARLLGPAEETTTVRL